MCKHVHELGAAGSSVTLGGRQAVRIPCLGLQTLIHSFVLISSPRPTRPLTASGILSHPLLTPFPGTAHPSSHTVPPRTTPGTRTDSLNHPQRSAPSHSAHRRRTRVALRLRAAQSSDGLRSRRRAAGTQGRSEAQRSHMVRRSSGGRGIGSLDLLKMMVGRTGAPSSHASTQFLNTVLSQRGPQALPYVEDDKWSIRQHLLLVIQEFPGLQVKTAVFTHNDGRTSNLLQADGTIPMYYQDVKYNIPITMWLLETYPRQPPLVFVTPTRDMIIKPRHANVDASGMVNSPCIQHWVFPRSNLVELVQSLSLLFGQDPPLYSRPSAAVRPPPPTSHPPPFINPIHTGGSMQMNPSSPGPSSQSPRLALTYPPYQHTPPPPPQRRSDDPQEQWKNNVVQTLSDRLRNDINKINLERNNEMDKLFNTQALLAQRTEQLRNGVRELVDEKGALEDQLQATLTNTEILENWLKANDKGITHVDIDDVFEPVDALSKQLLECQASDLAIEDILYAVDKGAQELVIPVEAYLKHVRVLAREQFFHRATSQRIRQMQMSSQVESMAARAPYVS